MAARHRSKAADRVHWHVPIAAHRLAHRAVREASACFADQGDAAAALGWLFSRFPDLGAAGDDMVQHHLRLRDDAYYSAWVRFCRRLELRL